MKILFANIPFIKHQDNKIFTGPNAGSRWPWTLEGHHFHGYAPYPFWLGYAMSYVKSHGFDCHFYDGVAMKHYDINFFKQYAVNLQPDIIFFDVATPTFSLINDVAKWCKLVLNCRIVFCGPHMKVYADECIKLPHIDHCVIGEFDVPALDICQKQDKAEKIYKFQFPSDIDRLPNGENFVPYRPLEYLHNYYDGSMPTPLIQLTVSTSRGCPFKCTYCQWPNVINNGKYRSRSTEMVLDEIEQIRSVLKHNLRSIFFDDDTWNVGTKRTSDLCDGLKKLNLPWTMMGRIDTSKPEMYHKMVDSGCVGMRFGIETFNQKVSDNVKKKMDTNLAYKNMRYLVENFSNMEFHFTTMKNLPGESAGSWEKDQQILKELQTLGQKRNNRVHWQISDCIPFPGTELWEELVSMGKGESLKDFSMYDGSLHNNGVLEKTVQWLGDDYKPKYHEYSNIDGAPTDMPKD